MLEPVIDHWPKIVWALAFVMQVVTSGHALLYKRDSRSAISWVGLIWLVPFIGFFFYLLFGINRIQRKASAIRSSRIRFQAPKFADLCTPQNFLDAVSPQNPHLATLAKLVERITERTLFPGNEMSILENGEETYPRMLQEINQAERSISLSTYIFNNDEIGKVFLEALAKAAKRGVSVRVLVDDIGARYSWPSIVRTLQREQVPVARFLPTYFPGRLAFLNMRNHRKNLIVDGRIGFSGGMNIEDDHLVKNDPTWPTRDLHFRIEGPVVTHLQETFAEDWVFSTGEILEGKDWFPVLEKKGRILARGISSGPDEDFELMRWTILGALDSAQRSVKIITPYFVPDQQLITSINLCSLKGLEVDIILPENNNLAVVRWASMAQLWQMLEHGARIWLTLPPFDHSKIMIVDDAWVFFGSGNWDMRSLRLNFEFNVECYDTHFAAQINQVIAKKLKSSRQLSLQEVDARILPIKIRDGLARLFSPYL